MTRIARQPGRQDACASDYRSPFGQWDEYSSMRPGAGRRHQPSCEPSGDWFCEHPGISDHPLVLEAGRRDAVLAALLVAYLDFTVHLELTSIITATRDLVMRRLGADYGAAFVRDALRVQCDEAFHALMCSDLAEHAARITGIQRLGFPEHHFFHRVRELSARIEGVVDQAQFAFCVAVIAETVITDSLFRDRRDAALRSDVRAVLSQHYRDEIRHTIFFSEALKIIFPQWATAVREAMAPIWQELVLAFLHRDEEVTATALIKAGLSDCTARRIVADGLTGDGGLAARNASVHSTLRALTRAGVILDQDGRWFADRIAAAEARAR